MSDENVIGTEKKKTKKKQVPNKNKKASKKTNKKKNGNTKKMRKQAKVLLCLILFFVAVILILCSPLFNIKNIEVEGNTKLSDERVISVSSVQTNTNIFKLNVNWVKEKIKEVAYVDSVEIIKKFPSTVKITINERQPKYMLQFADSYVYINNQGYMLEISNEKLDLPILIGFSTDLSNIKAGNRINVADLKKMDMVIKIYEAIKSNGLGELVSKIDISNDKNYAIILETEGKTVCLH